MKKGWMIILLCSMGWSGLASTATYEVVEFSAADGTVIFGELYRAAEKKAPVLLLFHQARSNRGEYRTIAPKLVEHGYSALAIDQRSGGEMWHLSNKTVAMRGASTPYLDALPDLEAALRWTHEQLSAKRTIVCGSSYSAALLFLLTARHRDEIDGLIAFSPGEYLEKEGLVAREAAKLKLPILVLTPPGERSRAVTIFNAIKDPRKRLVTPKYAVHGASMLIRERSPKADLIWKDLLEFLAQFN